MCRNSEKWAEIVEALKVSERVGDSLALTCGQHPNKDIVATIPEDFQKRPDGGCLEKCNYRLRCGHVCPMYCHTYDLKHSEYKCLKKCDKLVETCGHYCKQQCSHTPNICNKCDVLVDKIVDECGHSIQFRCDSVPKRSDCRHKCDKILACGHSCLKNCNVLKCAPCETILPTKPVCKHQENNIIYKYCYDEKWKLPEKCTLDCNEALLCGHTCSDKCASCFSGRIHGKCSEKYGFLYSEMFVS